MTKKEDPTDVTFSDLRQAVRDLVECKNKAIRAAAGKIEQLAGPDPDEATISFLNHLYEIGNRLP